MILSHILLAMFPKSFQDDFGSAWQSVMEDMVQDAKQKGLRSIVWFWLASLLDTAWRAPLVHLASYKTAIIGQPLVLAGLGPVDASRAILNHWVARPAKGFALWIESYGPVMVFGAALGCCVNVYLSMAAEKGWFDDKNTGYDAEFLKQVFFFTIFFWCAAHVFFNLKKIWFAWRQKGFPVVAPFALTTMACVQVLFLFFVAELPDIGRQQNSSFVSYPHYAAAPIKDPNMLDESAVTDEHKKWFIEAYRTQNSEGKSLPVWELRAEKKELWCGIKLALVESWKTEIISRPYQVGNEINMILWRGHLMSVAGYGCLSSEEVLQRETEMGHWTNKNVSFVEKKWKPMISVVPVVDALLSSKYVLGPRLLPQPLQYCNLLSMEKARSLGVLSSLDPSQQFCLDLEQKWIARQGVYQSDKPIPANQLFSPTATHTDYFEDQLQNTTVFDQEDLAWAREQVDQNWDLLLKKDEAKQK